MRSYLQLHRRESERRPSRGTDAADATFNMLHAPHIHALSDFNFIFALQFFVVGGGAARGTGRPARPTDAYLQPINKEAIKFTIYGNETGPPGTPG